MNITTAARMALNALEYHTQQTRPIHSTELAIDALREALALPEPQASPVPDDMVMVPREPTPEMRHAGWNAWMLETQAALMRDPGPEQDGPRSNIAAAYRAMIAAAPPAAPAPVVREPLTKIQLLGGLMDAGLPDKFFDAFKVGARFAEQSHGIGTTGGGK